MYLINGYLIIIIRLRVLLKKKINATLILKVDKYSEILKISKFDRYIETEEIPPKYIGG